VSKSELFDNLDQLRRSEGKVALATLVNTRGTTPRKEGAQMLVGDGGRVLGSVTIGGCVDAQVIEESTNVLGANRPRLLELDLGDEEAWEIGLTCGGTIEVFMEPVTLDKPGDATLALYERARAHAEAGGRAAIVTRLDEAGNGAKLLALDTGVVERLEAVREVRPEVVAEGRQRDPVLRPTRTGDRRVHRPKVERQDLVERRAVAGLAPQALLLGIPLDEVDPLGRATRQAQVRDRLVVDGEERGRRPELGAHVGDRRPVGEGQPGQAIAGELDEGADDAVLPEHLGYHEDEVRAVEPRGNSPWRRTPTIRGIGW